MLGQNVTDGATDILVASPQDTGKTTMVAAAAAHAARPNACIYTTCWLFIYI
jgi:hypothetical protein